MKTFTHLLLTAAVAAALTGCQKSGSGLSTSVDEHQARPAGGETKTAGTGDAVTLKEGHGLALHPKLRASIGLKVAEVAEEKVAPVVTAQLHVVRGADGLRRVALTPDAATEASGWMPAAQAAHMKPGQEVELRAAGAIEKGVVKRVEKPAFAALGEFEVVVETDASFDTGSRLDATFRAPAGDAVPAVPRSALLKTAEGWFGYVVNESFFLRTPVKLGAMNEELAEVTEGLYAGDQIVVSPVNSLWMAELQILRGGKSCTCGH